jgi:HlyD family secretion protein
MNRTVEAAAARVKSGEAKLNYAERNLARTRKLNNQKPKVKSDDELEQAEVAQVESSVNYQQDVLVHRAVEAIRAATALMPTAVRQYIQRKNLSHDVLAKQLAEAEVALQQAQRDAERGRMISPVDGVVLERAVSNEGQYSAGTLLLRIGRWEDLEVEADILSQEVVNVKPDESVELSGPAIGTPVARGKVQRVYPAGFTKVSSLGVEQQRVKVIVKFLGEDLERLRSERDLGVDYRVMVRIFTAEKSGALVVPRSAVFRGPAGDWRLYAIRGGHARLQTVQLGLSNDEQAEITSGVEDGELVILAPETNLVDGQSVRPQVVRGE